MRERERGLEWSKYKKEDRAAEAECKFCIAPFVWGKSDPVRRR